MRLRDLFMILLLCMTVGVFSVACTGDDGEAGVQGPQGEQGPPGEDAGSVEYNYSFLPSWGQASGKMACDDPLITSTGVFPGPAELKQLVGTNGQPAPVRQDAICGTDDTGILVAVAPDLNGDGAPDEPGVGLVFNVTHTGAEKPVMTQVPPQGKDNPRLMTTTKHFSGGMVFAKLASTGSSDEAFSRAQLYHDCGGVTAPPEVQGEFRAVQIVEEDVVLGVDETTSGATEGTYIPLDATKITTTTRKVCVRLDSLPGAVKCYYSSSVRGDRAHPEQTAGTITTTEQIGIYRDEELHAVMPMASLATAAAEGTPATTKGLVNPQGADPAQTSTGGTTGGPTAGTPDDDHINLLRIDVNADGVIDTDDGTDIFGPKLCNLFEETAQ